MDPSLKGPVLELSTLGCSSTHNNTFQVLQRTTLGPKPPKGSFILIPSPLKRTPMYDYWILLLKTVINTIKLASCVLRTYDHAHSATLLFGNTKWCMYTKPNILRSPIAISRVFIQDLASLTNLMSMFKLRVFFITII